jgi:hypothetical protein
MADKLAFQFQLALVNTPCVAVTLFIGVKSCRRAQLYLFTELLRLGIHIPCMSGARFSGLEGPNFFPSFPFLP